MFINTASQKIAFFAYDTTNNVPKTGDAANLTAYVSKDGGAVTVLADTSATEMDATNAKGMYLFDLAQGETNGDMLVFTCKSSTSGVQVDPIELFTTAAGSNALTNATIATAVWQDATAGDFTVASSIGKALYTGNVVPGGSGGLLISGSNAGTTTLGALTITGATTFSGAVGLATTLTIGGNFILTNMNLSGSINVGANLSIGANLAILGTTEFFGTVALDSTLTVTGAFVSTNASNDIRGVKLSATQVFNNTGTWTGNLTGSVGSVTGNVGGNIVGTVASVVGNVGGNVTGSVGSITGTIGTFDALNTSLNSQHGSGSWQCGGVGPKAVTIHTTDGSVALGGVLVSVQDGTDATVATGLTNGSGNLLVNLLASTQYTINTYKGGYTSSPSVQTTSAGNGAQTLTTIVLTAVPSPVPPADPTLQTVYGTLQNIEGPDENVEVHFSIYALNPARPLTVGGVVVTFDEAVALTDNAGFFTIDLPRTDLFDADSPAAYRIVCKPAEIDLDGISLGAAPLDISTL